MTTQGFNEEEEVGAVSPPVPEPEEKDELADLFEVPQSEDNDMVVDHLVNVDEEDDVSDLVEVKEEDVMGEDFPGVPSGESSETQLPRQFKRTGRRRFIPPSPTTLGGIRS